MFKEQKPTQRLHILCVILLFIVFGAEAFLGHSFLLASGRWQVYLPILFSAAGVVVSSLILLNHSNKMLAIFKLTMILSIVVALMGFYFHSRIEHVSGFLLSPGAAPLSYLIPGIIGLVATRRKSIKSYGGPFPKEVL